jgi:hypothetical protein
MDNIVEKLDNINQTLEKHFGKQNEIVEKMLDNMQKPVNPFIRVLEFIVLLAGALGIFTTADLIRSLVLGG